MMAFGSQALADLRRWIICGTVVVLAHGGMAAAMVAWHEPVEPDDPTGGFAIEVASVAAAPDFQSELPPGPPQEYVPPSVAVPVEAREEAVDEQRERKVEAKPTEDPPPEEAPAPDPEVALAVLPPEEKKGATPQPQEASPMVLATAPVVIPEEKAPVAAAPEQSRPNPNTSAAVKAWNKQISAIIQRNLRY